MTRRDAPEPSTTIREGNSAGQEPTSVVKTWRRVSRPRNSILKMFGDGASSQLLASVDDPAFVVSMRTRLLTMRPTTLGDWPWLRRLMRIGGNRTRMVAYEMKRLLQIAGQAPPEGLHDQDHVTVSYDRLQRMVEAAEAALSRTTEPSS